MYRLRFYFPIYLQLASVIFFLMLILLSFSSFFVYRSDYRDLESQLGTRLLSMAATASVSIDGERHQSIRTSEDIHNPNFIEIYNLLSSIKVVNSLTNETIYTFGIEQADNDLKNTSVSLFFAVMLHPESFIGDYYEVPEHNIPYIKKVLEGHSTKTPIYKDQYGEWISAYAPITSSSSGAVVGILEVDFDVRFFIEELQGNILFFLKLGILLAFFMALGSYLISRFFAASLVQLKMAFNIIEEGNSDGVDLYFTKKQIFRDEFSEVKNSFNAMLVRLKERMMMLNYLSIHTKEMIRQVLRGEISESGQLKDVVVLFSDIRGFSKFSDSQEPEFIISYLNKILSIQSDIIIEHGGSIDKYVGDEIIAIFEGELAADVAALTGVRIQKALKENFSNIEKFPYNLLVGIGIHYGRMVMGNVGNKYHRDYTVIGGNVNLASRLVTAAEGGQILASEDLINQCKRKDFRFKSTLFGKYKFKGINKSVLVYEIKATEGL